jgi:hypothetical protein
MASCIIRPTEWSIYGNRYIQSADKLIMLLQTLEDF